MEYTIRIEKDNKTGWYCGQCEEIPEAISQGKDIPELMIMMEDAIMFALEIRRDEFREQYADRKGIVRKMRFCNEKKLADKASGRKRIHVV